MNHPDFEAVETSPERIRRLLARARSVRARAVGALVTRAVQRLFRRRTEPTAALHGQTVEDSAGGIAIRPAGPGDREAIQAFVRKLSPRSRYLRFFSGVQELPPQWLDRFARPASESELTLLVLISQADRETPVAMAQYAAGRDRRGEFAIVVADEWQGKGIGKRLIRELACIGRGEGLLRLEGDVLAENGRMLRMASALGIVFERDPESAGTLRASLSLSDPRWRCRGTAFYPV